MSRTTTCFNYGWQFHLDKVHGNTPLSNDAPKVTDEWRSITLPHDWSVEHPFDPELDGATGYLPGGIGWYKKSFIAPNIQPNQRVYLLFEGIYNNSELRLNGHLLARQSYGYAPFFVDITDHITANNTLLVRVDRRRYVDSRWYTGSGIYRDVKMVITDPLHFSIWGHTLQTPKISPASATIEQSFELEVPPYLQEQIRTLVNDGHLQIESSVYECGSSHPLVSGVHTKQAIFIRDTHQTQHLNQRFTLTISFELPTPKLWSISTPSLYQVHNRLLLRGELIDELSEQFGVRSIHFDAQNGFHLNGEPTKIKGVCLHHDGGLVGAAVPDAVWRRRLLKLKECGVNAIRCAHNPASLPFLHLCDELGLLVQEEFFDEWDYPKDKRLNMGEQHDDFVSRGTSEYFLQTAKSDLTTTLKSRINHPCIFMWSIGNEIEWTYPRNVEATGFFDASWDGNYFWSLPPHSPQEIERQLKTLPIKSHDIGKTAQKLSKWVKELDRSRPVTANCILPSSSYLSGYADALDVIGFSYRRVVYDYGHEHYPHLPIIGNENLGQWHEWKAALERPFVSGIFLWTGINYMGESHNQWPTHTTNSGLLDSAGFEKASFYMFQSLWCDEPCVRIVTQSAEETDLLVDKTQRRAFERDPDAWQQKLWLWPDREVHWNYTDGEWVVIEVYTNCFEVELMLNGDSVGTRILEQQDDHIMRWAVPFDAGELLAIGRTREGKELSRHTLTTSGSAQSVAVSVESNSKDAQYRHVILQTIDADGLPVTHQPVSYRLELTGGTLVGVDNGAKDNPTPYQSDTITTHHGRALALVKLEGTVAKLDIYEEDSVAVQSIHIE